MKSLRASFIAPLFGLLMSVAACSGQAPTEGTASGENAVVETASATQHHSARKAQGPASLISIALRDPSIKLTDTQRATIEAAAKTLAPKHQDHSTQKAALAAAVRAGNVDALMAKPSTDVKTDKKAALSNALTVLHSTLTKEQRVALVAAAGKRHEGNKGDKVAHAKHDGKNGKGMFASLDLTQEQKDQIKAKMLEGKPAKKTEADREAMKAKFVAMKKARAEKLQSFTADSFDVAAFLARPEGEKAVHQGGMSHKLAVILPILTPDQREKLAIHIEQGHQKPQKPAAL
ncbi:MAG: hypothetical protein ACXVCJ_28990 [Polyangiales bacterium]